MAVAVVGFLRREEAGWRRHKLGGELVAGNGGGRENGRGGAETEREARIRLGFGRGGPRSLLTGSAGAAGGSPSYSKYGGHAPRRGSRRAKRRGSRGPPVSDSAWVEIDLCFSLPLKII